MSNEFIYTSMFVAIIVGGVVGYYLSKKNIHLPFI